MEQLIQQVESLQLLNHFILRLLLLIPMILIARTVVLALVGMVGMLASIISTKPLLDIQS